MERPRWIWSAISLLALLVGCAAPVTQRVTVSDQATKDEAEKQRDIAIQEFVDEQKRLARIHGVLAIKAVSLCPAVGPYLGLFTMSKPANDFAAAYERVFGIQNRLTTLFVVENSPAERAGLKPRDVILKINGASVAEAKAATEVIDKIALNADVPLEIERAGAKLTLAVQPVKACRYPARVTEQQIINAFADGKSVFVARGMMSFAKNDVELATVLGHEMAHNTMAHIEAKKQNMGVGFVADLAALLLSRGRVSNTNFAQLGAQAYSQEFEAEADYVGLYILAEAGFPIDNAPSFWRRMAAGNPSGISASHASSHPSTPYRMLALEETVKEIKDKIAKGLPLTPNLKDGKPQRPAQETGKK